MLIFECRYQDKDAMEHTTYPHVAFSLPGEATLTDVLAAFENFLKAAGYVFDGVVDIVPEDCAYSDEHFGDPVDDRGDEIDPSIN